MTPLGEEQRSRIAELLSQRAIVPNSVEIEGGIPLAFDDAPRFDEVPKEPAPKEPAPVKKTRKFASTTDVLKQLDKRADGTTPQSNLKNAIKLLRAHPAWNVPPVLFYDEFALQIRTKNPPPWGGEPGGWTDTDDIRTADWLQRFQIIVNPNVARDAVELIAKESVVHPVREYLNGLTWDQRPRVSGWLSAYLGASPNRLNTAIGKAWLVSAVARIFRPGCQADYTLSLEGMQGLGKSTVLRILAGNDWFTDHVSDLASKDSRIELLGKWIVELAELGPVRRSENERVKQFLTARFDSYRPPYGRRTCQIPRQCVFAATFNDSTPFTDVTGNRRFWPIACGRLNVKGLEQDRDQLWGEAFKLYQTGALWWLDSAELNREVAEEQSARLQADPWDDMVLTWANDPQTKTLSEIPLLSHSGQVTVPEILTHAVGKPAEKWDRSDEMRVSQILVKSGWSRKRVRLSAKQQGIWFYLRPAQEIR